MKAIIIRALTPLGEKGIRKIKKESESTVEKWALKKIKTTLIITKSQVIIKNPAFRFYTEIKEENKARLGIEQIVEAYSEMGAKENKDYIIKKVM